MREPKEILINGKTLEKILENRKHWLNWLNRDIDGWENMCAKKSKFIILIVNIILNVQKVYISLEQEMKLKIIKIRGGIMRLIDADEVIKK